MAVHIVQELVATCDTSEEATQLAAYLADRIAAVGDVTGCSVDGLTVTFGIALHIAPPVE